MTAAQFKRWRKRLGFSQPQAAKALGVHVGTLRNWEYGRRKVSTLVEKLCAAVENENRDRLE